MVKPWTVSGVFYASLNFLILEIFVQNLLTCFSFVLSIATDRGGIPLNSSPDRTSYWCYPSLGFKQFLFDQDTDALCLFPRFSFGLGCISCWMV